MFIGVDGLSATIQAEEQMLQLQTLGRLDGRIRRQMVGVRVAECTVQENQAWRVPDE